MQGQPPTLREAPRLGFDPPALSFADRARERRARTVAGCGGQTCQGRSDLHRLGGPRGNQSHRARPKPRHTAVFPRGAGHLVTGVSTQVLFPFMTGNRFFCLVRGHDDSWRLCFAYLVNLRKDTGQGEMNPSRCHFLAGDVGHFLISA